MNADKNNGKGKTSGKQSTLIKNESNLENPKSSSSSGEYRLPLVWIDLEMTGIHFIFIPLCSASYIGLAHLL